MKFVYYKSLMLVCVMVLASCNSAQTTSSNNINNINTAGINNPFICCNDVPEYCLRGHSQEHILECARIMSKYRKGIIADKSCNCVDEIDVLQKKVDALSQDRHVERVRYGSVTPPPAKKVVRPAAVAAPVAAKRVVRTESTSQQRVFIQPPTPKVAFDPASAPQPKPPVPTFANVVPSPKKVAYVEPENEAGCDPCKSVDNHLDPSYLNAKDTTGCVCATCVCPK